MPDDPSAADLDEEEVGAEMDGRTAESDRRGVDDSDRRTSEGDRVEDDGSGRASALTDADGTLRATQRLRQESDEE